MIRYYKLFDLLNRRGMNKSTLLQVTSSKTIAKLSKGEYVNGETIDKLCLFLDCQPDEIMEVFKVYEMPTKDGKGKKIKCLAGISSPEKIMRERMEEEIYESYEKVKKEMEEKES